MMVMMVGVGMYNRLGHTSGKFSLTPAGGQLEFVFYPSAINNRAFLSDKACLARSELGINWRKLL